MILGVMLLAPIVIYLATIMYASKLKPVLRWVYFVLGGLIVFGGTSASVYFAGYTGDQGGVAALFFQIVFVVAYALVSIIVVVINWILFKREKDKT